MTYAIKKAAVLGSGIMGSGIAAHLANAGILSVMLDIVPRELTPDEQKRGLTLQDKVVRNRIGQQALDKAVSSKPAALYTPKGAGLITVGNFEDDWDKIADADWVIEVVVERLDIKRSIFQKVKEYAKPDAIISSNTSGLRLASIVEGMGEDFEKRFLITHFFNPVRYMRLLEIVPGAKTDPELTTFMQQFGTDVLGKGVVIGKDAPAFIANRIGLFGFANILKRMAEGDSNGGGAYSVAEVDAIFGPAMGRPKSAVFRTTDLSGLDTTWHVAKNIYENAPDDEAHDLYTLPDWVERMYTRGMLGDKTGSGFYKKTKSADGETVILEIDQQTLDYVAQRKLRMPSLNANKNADDLSQKLKVLVYSNDRAGELAWKATADTLIYIANRVGEIADDIYSIDRAMRWGYNWQLGPFESWDVLGVAESVAKMEAEGRTVPQLVRDVLQKGQGAFYRHDGARTEYWDVAAQSYQLLPQEANTVDLAALRRPDSQNGGKNRVIRENAGATLYDMGDGVACLEFHTKLNALDPDIFEMMQHALETVKDGWKGLVIGNQADDFSAGANLFLALMGANNDAWTELEASIKTFQDLNTAIKFSPVPVVVAVAGRALGGGCEIPLAAARVRAAAEAYFGLVEVGVGLIPGGGGTKEILLRQLERLPKGGPFRPVQAAFELIGYAKVSTSAADAMSMGILRKTDQISLNRDLLLGAAKRDVLQLADGYVPPTPKTFRLPGEGGRLAMEQAIDGFVSLKQISEYDSYIAKRLAWVLTGGDVQPIDEVSEQDLLDLERQVFLELLKQPKTRARMEHTLATGKPLRN